MAPDLPEQAGPYRDGYPVDELWIVNGLSETLGLCNVERMSQGLEPWNANPLFLAGRVPNRIVVDGTNGLVVNSSGNSIHIFSLRSPARQGVFNLPAGSNPWDARFIHRTGRTYLCVTSFLRNSLSILEYPGGALVREMILTNGTRPQGLAVSGTRLWIAMSGWNFSTGTYDQGRVNVLDISDDDPGLWRLERSLAVRPNPQEIVPDNGGQIFVLSTGRYGREEGCLQVFADESGILKKEIMTGGSPRSLALDSVFGNIHLAGGNLHQCYNTGTLNPVSVDGIANAFVESDIAALALDAERRLLFAADFARDRILVVSLEGSGVHRVISVGDGPLAMAFGKTW